MRKPVREVSSRHWACGTEVREGIPDGCDLSEGLVLICPRCREPWWHHPDPAAEPAATPGGFPLAVDDSELLRRSWSGAEPDGGHETAGLPRRSPRSRWMAAVLALAAAGAGLVSLLGRDEPSGSLAPREIDAARQPGRAAPAVVKGQGFTLRVPAGWSARRQETTTLLFPRSSADVSLRAHSLLRRRLSLGDMGRLAVGVLRSELPGARVDRLRPARLDGRPALRVTARRSTLSRELIVMAAGERGYVVDLRRSSTAQRRTLAQAAGAVRSFRAAPKP